MNPISCPFSSCELSVTSHPYQPPHDKIHIAINSHDSIYLHIMMSQLPYRFRINFKTGPTDKHDTAFHFNPRMGSNVAMNSFSTGKWETGESVSDNPFKKGEAFEMFFVIKSEGYQVRDLVLMFCPLPQHSDSYRTESNFISLLQTIPYMGPISGGLREGMALYLQGAVPANAERFRINFKTGPTDKHDTAFHFNPRMGSNVAMNSFSTGKWETGESVSDNPFKKGEAFEMFFVIKSEGYQVRVYVNGKELYTFKHRIPLEKVTTLNINGDIAVNLFGFIEVSYIF
uniref:Galectin n=1 Tax=Cyprinus carpio TaxID=7962 RepID=A0A8C2CVZ7_CYPCA